MGFVTFVKELFLGRTLSPEQLETRRQVRIERVLIVMAKRYHDDESDAPSLATIYRGLSENGWHMSAPDLIETMKSLVEAGFVQRIDGGNKKLSLVAVDYAISNDGLNRVGFSGR